MLQNLQNPHTRPELGILKKDTFWESALLLYPPCSFWNSDKVLQWKESRSDAAIMCDFLWQL